MGGRALVHVAEWDLLRRDDLRVLEGQSGLSVPGIYAMNTATPRGLLASHPHPTPT